MAKKTVVFIGFRVYDVVGNVGMNTQSLQGIPSLLTACKPYCFCHPTAKGRIYAQHLEQRGVSEPPIYPWVSKGPPFADTSHV